jgi:enterochelin esterase-like enzyme
MQPTSGLFLALLASLAIGAAALTVLTWDRARWRRTRRLGLLLLSQSMVVLLGLSLVNTSQGFFTDWSDFAGGEAHAAKNSVKGRVPGAQLREAVEAARRKVRPHHGVVISATVRGRRTGYALPVRIYLPEVYFDRTQEDRRFPVVMFFNGFLGGVDTFQQRLGADTALDQLIAAQRVQPLIAIIPEKNPSRPRDSECVDAVSGDKADTYLTQDIPDVARSELRVSLNRSGWALMGYSTGGFCAMNLSLRHPTEFAAAINLSGNYIPYVDETTGELFGHDPAARKANNPADTVSQPRQCPLSFYLFSSKGDPVGAREMRQFVPKIKPPDAVTAVTLPAGGHNFNVWRTALPDAFVWASRVLHPYGSSGCPPTAPDPGSEKP